MPFPRTRLVTVDANAAVDIGGFNTTINSLRGTGTVTNTGSTASVFVGGDNQATIFAGNFTDGANSLNVIKIGSGTMTLSAVNTHTGTTTVQQGTLELAGLNGSIKTSSAIVLNGGTFKVTNNAAANNTDRIGNGVGLTSLGGTFLFSNDSGASSTFSESLGKLTLTGGLTQFILNTTPDTAGTSTMTFADLVHKRQLHGSILGAGLGASTAEPDRLHAISTG